ncbi:MAG: nucleotidyl transferase AbiEii/AbiGii toxin family protein [Candidatus Berkelbacteria bacterium]|nr:nucleotidyl transferase AbiEii/AbiGii toxin family protein [Candidatus Berkelbacteria bacterium]MCR4307357.1 nucleotidyl transferase AbiEii/AbiGii toxin family protein [Candidatus Berkelbacteria bacterium]
MHKEVLTKEQIKLLPFVAEFSRDFGLVGGTALALYLGHRQSVDFDLFSQKKFGNQSLLNKILLHLNPDGIIINRLGELTLMVRGVKLTFFQFPFLIEYTETFEGIRLPDPLTLAAMKAFALGQRAKWKDYVDLYFIIKDHFSIKEISQKGNELFGHNFNEKLFRSQLAYFEGINYDEQVEFMPGLEVPDEIIKKALIDFSLEI